jgi:hypothetical protein
MPRFSKLVGTAIALFLLALVSPPLFFVAVIIHAARQSRAMLAEPRRDHLPFACDLCY